MQPPVGILAAQEAGAATASAVAGTVVSTAAATSSASSGGGGARQGECRLLGPFALLVQGALGALALLALVYKRWRERPQRPVRVWFFDVSKQVFGSVLVHMANIFMSMLTSGRFSIGLGGAAAAPQRLLRARADDRAYVPNPCSFYLLNLAIDTTLGIPILIVLLRVMTGLVAMTPAGQPPESIQSGNYGNLPNVMWWLKQSIVYFCGLFGMKVCVLVIFVLMPWISRVGDWALGWTEGNERLQIAFVMMIFPLIMNGLQYYIIDSFIKKQEPEHERLPSEDPDPRCQEATRLQNQGSARPSDSDDGGRRDVRARRSVEVEYDPDVDGDAPTVIGSSSSCRIERAKVEPSELFAKE